MKKILILTLASLLLASCLTQKKREDIAYRYFRDQPTKLAELCASNFPVTPEYIPGKPIYTPGDTVIIPGDTVYKDCPDGSKVPCPPNKTISIRDTIKIVDTIKRVDAAALAAIRGNLEQIKVAGAVLTADNKRLSSENTKKTWVIVGLSLLLAGSAFVLFRKIFLP